MHFVISSFYKFIDIESPLELKTALQKIGRSYGLCGTILIAPEGINSTIAAPKERLRQFMRILKAENRFSDLEEKLSSTQEKPFYRFKVKLKKEIVTMGVPEIKPTKGVGTYVSPGDWNELIARPDVTVVDTRNKYEYAIGHFRGAVDPQTDTFRDFPAWAEKNLDPEKTPNIAMYCTGGIRCEKATALLRERGFSQVYHLQGGILKYLENVTETDSTWSGSCFVFDNRVSLRHGLEIDNYENCPGCRHPLSPEDRGHPLYEAGVVCHHCAAYTGEAARAARRERQRQVELARQRGLSHIGQPPFDAP